MAKKGDKPATIGNRVAPLRFILFLLVFASAVSVGAIWMPISRSALLGFDIAAATFLLSCVSLLKRSAPEQMRRYALENDGGRILLLIVTGVVMAVLMVLIAVELQDNPSSFEKVLVLLTLVLAWLFSNTVYAFHYAHLCYSAGGARDRGSGGVDFPKTDDPDYWDFLYFAFTLGMTFQTSDVTITDREIRRMATIHCLAAFAFNLGLIAFTISVLGR